MPLFLSLSFYLVIEFALSVIGFRSWPLEAFSLLSCVGVIIVQFTHRLPFGSLVWYPFSLFLFLFLILILFLFILSRPLCIFFLSLVPKPSLTLRRRFCSSANGRELSRTAELLPSPPRGYHSFLELKSLLSYAIHSIPPHSANPSTLALSFRSIASDLRYLSVLCIHPFFSFCRLNLFDSCHLLFFSSTSTTSSPSSVSFYPFSLSPFPASPPTSPIVMMVIGISS